MNLEGLKQFLIEANISGYASDNATVVKEDDGSYSTQYKNGIWQCHDNWFGGEPFGGREVILYKNKPFWMMVYYGSEFGEAEGIIAFLKKALSLPPEDMPVRGPAMVEDGDFVYSNSWQGDIDSFFGEETIRYRGEKVYKASYIGGLVAQIED